MTLESRDLGKKFTEGGFKVWRYLEKKGEIKTAVGIKIQWKTEWRKNDKTIKSTDMMVIKGQTSSWSRKVKIADIIQLRNIVQIIDACFSQGIAVSEIIQKKIIKKNSCSRVWCLFTWLKMQTSKESLKFQNLCHFKKWHMNNLWYHFSIRIMAFWERMLEVR